MFVWNSSFTCFKIIDKYQISNNQINLLILKKAHEGIPIENWDMFIQF